MDPTQTVNLRRLGVVIASAVVCLGAGVGLLLFETTTQHRILGVDMTSGLTGAVYTSATIIGVTTFRWLRSTRSRERRITVQELRRRARSGR